MINTFVIFFKAVSALLQIVILGIGVLGTMTVLVIQPEAMMFTIPCLIIGGVWTIYDEQKTKSIGAHHIRGSTNWQLGYALAKRTYTREGEDALLRLVRTADSAVDFDDFDRGILAYSIQVGVTTDD